MRGRVEPLKVGLIPVRDWRRAQAPTHPYGAHERPLWEARKYGWWADSAGEYTAHSPPPSVRWGDVLRITGKLFILAGSLGAFVLWVAVCVALSRG